MNKFTQHVPATCDIDEPLIFNFNTTEELLMSEYVQGFAKIRPSTFVMSGRCLMTVSDNGYHWWVLGYIENPKEINLPQWNGPKYK